MNGLIQRAEALALERAANLRDSLGQSLAIWLPGISILIDASGLRLVGRDLHRRWNRGGLSQHIRADHDER
jgi:hypothetical protein